MRTNRPLDVPHPGWLLVLLVLMLVVNLAGCSQLGKPQAENVRLCAMQLAAQDGPVAYVWMKCMEE